MKEWPHSHTNGFKKMNDIKDIKDGKIFQADLKDFKLFISERYREHYVDNEYEPMSSRIIKNYLKDGDTFVDVGSHFGYFATLASKAAKNVKVIAVEPVSENASLLRKNASLNNIQDIEIIECAVSAEKGEVEFNITEASDSAGIFEHPNTKTIKKRKLPALSVDEILKSRKADFIKIDTEGNELAVLSGMKNTIRDNPKLKMLLEVNPKCLQGAGFSAQDLLDKIHEYGFEITLIDDLQKQFFRVGENIDRYLEIVESRGYANLFVYKKGSISTTAFFSQKSK